MSDLESVRSQLKQQQEQSQALQAQLAAAQAENERLKAQFLISEQEEELIANQLLKRLEELKKDKEQLVIEVEQEEEYLTNTLQQKLNQLRQEKIEMENQLEQEEEFLTNKLQKKLDEILAEKDVAVARAEAAEKKYEALRLEMKEYREKNKKTEAEYNTMTKRNTRLRQQAEKLRTDNFVLNQRIRNEKERFDEIKQEKFLLEANMERQSERVFNVHSRSSGAGRGSHNNSGDEDFDLLSSSVPIRSSSIPIQMCPSSPPDSFSGSLSRRIDLDRPVPSSPIRIGMMSPAEFSPLRGDLSPPSRGGFAVPSSPVTPIMSSSFVDSFLQSRAHENNPRVCLRRGWLKKLTHRAWVPCMFVVYDSGELMYCDSETGVTSCLNLDTVVAVHDVSKQPKGGKVINGLYPNYSFELKTNSSSLVISADLSKDFAEWMNLLKDLSPMA